ncbi:MAG: apolipoprotein A1/A4/E family protein [Actinomycetota bacterium]|nr:apolipoprotein A1/A4/E family protein [Actinomycetota bacterium]
MDEFSGRILRWAGASLIFLVGGAHALISGEHFLTAPYLGILFLANFFGSAVVAFALYWSPNRWPWLLGGLISGGTIAGFVVSRTVGLPGAPEFVGQWLNIAGLLTLTVAGAFLALSLLAITPQGRALLRTEQGRVDRERVSPAAQETPARFEDIEKEMAGIRSRMASDLTDLRKHAAPRVVKEQAKQNLRERLQGVLNPAKTTLERQQTEAPQSAEEQAQLVREAGKEPGRRSLSRVAESVRKDPRPLAALTVLGTAVALAARRIGGKQRRLRERHEGGRFRTFSPTGCSISVGDLRRRPATALCP